MPEWGDLVAREVERAALDRLLADVANGRGRLVLVEGEAGLGQTPPAPLPPPGRGPADLGRLVPDVPADRLDDLPRRTAGNPLFARELAALRDEPLPATVTAVLGRRVDRADEGDLLDVAAVVGEPAPLDL